jgi:non-specific serine/threonine protein kinase/serine/threonine-protein kinase
MRDDDHSFPSRGQKESGLPPPEDEATTLASPNPTPSGPVGMVPIEADPSFKKYRILQRLGAGGMGEVYEAEQLEPIRRRVALKVIKRGMDTDAVVARFQSERQALALMDHEAIAKVYDAGATPDGRPYFVMEHVRGIPITEYCEQSQLGIRDRLELFMRVCEGVQHAHQKGVIHRDLKPSNVLVTIHEHKPVPKIIDFGLAKATGHSLTDRTLYTEIGQLMGTPEYMSPEQAERSGLDVDTRTDVYALGVILYELLVGALPFDSATLRQGSHEEIRKRIREEEPQRPSTRVSTMVMPAVKPGAPRPRVQLGSLSRQLRGDLDWIVMKAMEKDRTRRYATASDLAADIQRHLGNEPVLAGPPSEAYRIRKFVMRNKVGVAAGGAIVLAVFLGGIGTTVGLLKARSAEHKAREEAQTSQQVTNFLVGLFRVADPESTLGSRITAREILDRGADQIERELHDRPQLQARLLGTMGDVYKSLGLYGSSRPLLQRALDLQRGFIDDAPLDFARTESSLGDLQRLSGNLAAAESLFASALATQEKLRAPDDPAVATALCDLGAVYTARGEYDKAEPLLERSLKIREAKLPPDHPDIARSASELGVLCWRQGRYAEAEPLLSRSISIGQKVKGENHPDVARALNNLAIVYRAEGRAEAAIPLYQRVLAIYENTYGPDHPRVATALNNLGRVLYDQGEYAAAGPLYERALAIQEKALGPDHPNLATTINNLANLRASEKKYDQAQALFRRALAIREKALGPDHPDVGWSLGDLGVLLRDRGDYAAAEPQFQRALAIFERRHVGEGVAWTLNDLAILNRKRGDLATAESYFQRAIHEFETAMGPTHPDLAKCLDQYASLLRQMGRTADAEAAEARARGIRSGSSAATIK